MPSKCYFNGDGECQYSHQTKKDCDYLNEGYCHFAKENKLLE